MARTSGEAARLRIVPANEVSWEDLRAVVGAARCFDSLCFCQRFKILKGWHSVGDEARAHRLRAQAECGYPDSDTTCGLVGYLDEEPVAWCGPIVMNTQEQLRQAMAELHDGSFIKGH